MIILGEQLISEEIFEKEFICNLNKCKGACCIEGDAGAPVLDAEVQILEQEFSKIKPFLTPESIADIERRGFVEKDEDDEWVTTCLPTGECNFVNRDANGILQCGIEQAWKAGETHFQKPISCHLYPIRAIKIGDFEGLNYNQWSICKDACELGKKEGVPVYQFLQSALERKYGKAWYQELEEIAKAYLGAKEDK